MKSNCLFIRCFSWVFIMFLGWLSPSTSISGQPQHSSKVTPTPVLTVVVALSELTSTPYTVPTPSSKVSPTPIPTIIALPEYTSTPYAVFTPTSKVIPTPIPKAFRFPQKIIYKISRNRSVTGTCEFSSLTKIDQLMDRLRNNLLKFLPHEEVVRTDHEVQDNE